MLIAQLLGVAAQTFPLKVESKFHKVCPVHAMPKVSVTPPLSPPAAAIPPLHHHFMFKT
jgi:hypothetical protein